MTSSVLPGRSSGATTEGDAPALVVTGLRKSYGSLEAVHGISLEVRRGEIFGLLGPNGAGKTTTLEILTGLRRAAGGSVAIFGIDIARDAAAARALLGVPLQESAYFEHLTLAEQLRYLGAGYGVRSDAKALLRYVALEERSGWKLKQLSAGEKQRFALAAALVNDPPLILLDQPSTGLAPTARRQLWGLIRSLRENGRTILLATADREEAEALCDRVAVMDQGRVVSIDTPATPAGRLSATMPRRPSPRRAATPERFFPCLAGRRSEDAPTC